MSQITSNMQISLTILSRVWLQNINDLIIGSKQFTIHTIMNYFQGSKFVTRGLLIESASSKRSLFFECKKKIGKSSETFRIFDKTLLPQTVYKVALFIKYYLHLKTSLPYSLVLHLREILPIKHRYPLPVMQILNGREPSNFTASINLQFLTYVNEGWESDNSTGWEVPIDNRENINRK